MVIPSEATIAGLAACLGISERRVAAVKAEGRLPLTANGRINLGELVRRGWAATLAARGEPIAFPEATAEKRKAMGRLAPALDFTEPLHQGFVMAALLALHEAPVCVVLAMVELGLSRAQAERAGDLVVLLLWEILNEQGRALGLPNSDTEGPMYAEDDLLAWRKGVRWAALFDAEGRSLVAGQMSESAAEEGDETGA